MRDGVTVEFSQPSVFIGRLAAGRSVTTTARVHTASARFRGDWLMRMPAGMLCVPVSSHLLSPRRSYP